MDDIKDREMIRMFELQYNQIHSTDPTTKASNYLASDLPFKWEIKQNQVSELHRRVTS